MTAMRGFMSGAAWMAAGNWIEQAVNFTVFVILARLLGTEAFGAVAMASVLVVLSEFLVRETLAEGIISARDPAAAEYDAAFWLLVGFSALLIAVMAGLAGPVAAFYGTPEVKGLILALSPTVFLIALTAVPVAILRRDMRFRVLSLRAALGVTVGGIVGIGMALSGYGLWSLVGQRLAQVGVNVALAWGAVGWRPGFAARRSDFGHAARFGGQVVGLRAAELVSTQAPILIIGAALGPSATGLFSLAWRIVEMLSFLVVTPIRMVAQPAFAAAQRKGGEAGGLLTEVSRFTGLLAFPLFFGIAAVAQPALKICFGEDWAGAVPVLAVLAVAGGYFSIEKIQQSLCLASGRAGALTAVAWMNASLIAGLSIILVRWGIAAVAVGMVLGYLLPWPIRFRITAAVAGVSVGSLVRPHLTPAVCSGLMAAASFAVWRLWPYTPGAGLALAVLTGAAIYCVLVAIFMPDRIRIALATLRPLSAPDGNDQ